MKDGKAILRETGVNGVCSKNRSAKTRVVYHMREMLRSPVS